MVATTPRERLNAAESRVMVLLCIGMETPRWNIPKHLFLAVLYWRALRHLKQGEWWLRDDSGDL